MSSRSTIGDLGSARALLRSMSVYSLTAILQRSTSIILLPLYTRYLNRTDYGILELLDLVTTVASLLVGARIGQALFYYYHRATDETESGRYITTALIGTALIGVVVGAIGLCFAATISRLIFSTPRYADLVRICLLGFSVSLPVEVGFCYLRVRNCARTFLLISLARLGGNVALNALFLIPMGLGVSAMLWSSLITTSFLAAYFIWTILSAITASFRVSVFVQMGRYSLPLALSGLGEFFLHFGDRLFLSRAVPLSDLGLYGLSYKLGMIVAFASLPFFTYWDSQMVGIVQRRHGEYIYARMATYLLLTLTTVALLMTAFIDPILIILVEPEFRGAAVLVPWIALAYLIRAMATYWMNTFLLEGRSSLVARTTWIGACACLLGYTLLIPRFGARGAVAATLIGFSSIAMIALHKGQRVRPFGYEYGRWGKILASGLAATLPLAIIRPSEFWPQVASGVSSILFYFYLLMLLRFLSEGERRAANDLLKRVRWH